MSSQRHNYTINPETGKQIKIGGPTWKQLAAKYYMIDGKFTDQTIPDSRAYLSRKVFGINIPDEYIAFFAPSKRGLRKREVEKHYDDSDSVPEPPKRASRKRVSDPAGKRKYLVVGSKAWNERYLDYEWNGHEFGEKRQRHLPGYLNTVEKRREMRRNKAFERFDRKVSQGRLSDVIDSSLGYALTYYHTVEGDMYKDWMKEKRTKKDFRLKNDDDNRLWVRLPGEKSEEEVEPINLVFDESEEFNKIVKKYILNGMREYNQCFITIMAYNLMWTHAGEAKILNLTDDRLGHLRIVRRERINE